MGGICVGMTLSAVLQALGAPERVEPNSEIELLHYGAMRVLVSNVVVEKLYADDGYLGRTAEGAYVGMSVEALLNCYEHILFDQEEGVWTPADVEGLGFELWDVGLTRETLGYCRSCVGSGRYGERLDSRKTGVVRSIVVFVESLAR